MSLEKKATLCIYICWRFFCLKSRWFVFLVERISFSVQNQLHLPLQSTVPFSSSLSPVLRRRAGPKTSVLKKKCIANPPPLLPLGRYPQFFSKFQSILPSALIKSLCPDQKEGHVCVSDSKCQPRFTSCTAKESCEGILVSCSDQGVLREISTCPFKRRRLRLRIWSPSTKSDAFPFLAQTSFLGEILVSSCMIKRPRFLLRTDVSERDFAYPTRVGRPRFTSCSALRKAERETWDFCVSLAKRGHAYVSDKRESATFCF